MTANAAIWVRVSTDRQHEDNQIPGLERLCQQRGWEITRRYEIADASAYKGEHRQALQRMLEDAHRGEFSVLVVWAVDRLCRQGIKELLRLIRQLRERNVSLVSHQEPWLNGTDSTTELLAAVAAWVATQESVRRSERIRAGLARAKPRQADRRRRLQTRQGQAPTRDRGLQTGMGTTQSSAVARRPSLLREVPEVVETDLNPVRCMTSGCVVLDMRLRIEPRHPVERVKTW
jgi:DNA invertase Pin-like site-specific DNA recombinase